MNHLTCFPISTGESVSQRTGDMASYHFHTSDKPRQEMPISPCGNKAPAQDHAQWRQPLCFSSFHLSSPACLKMGSPSSHINLNFYCDQTLKGVMNTHHKWTSECSQSPFVFYSTCETSKRCCQEQRGQIRGEGKEEEWGRVKRKLGGGGKRAEQGSESLL